MLLLGSGAKHIAKNIALLLLDAGNDRQPKRLIVCDNLDTRPRIVSKSGFESLAGEAHIQNEPALLRAAITKEMRKEFATKQSSTAA